MKILGINLVKGYCYYALLEGTKQSPVLVERARLSTITTVNIPELLDWYSKTFSSLIQSKVPSQITYRFQLDPSKDQITYIHYPLGVLCHLAYQLRLPINSYTPPSFVASKLGLNKGADLTAHCDQTFGAIGPHWDTNMKNAVLAAWFDL